MEPPGESSIPIVPAKKKKCTYRTKYRMRCFVISLVNAMAVEAIERDSSSKDANTPGLPVVAAVFYILDEMALISLSNALELKLSFSVRGVLSTSVSFTKPSNFLGLGSAIEVGLLISSSGVFVSRSLPLYTTA